METTKKKFRSASMKLQLPTQKPSDKKRVSFNEAELAEHDKERGTRMVIPDPDTPFMRSPVISDDEDSSPQVPRSGDPSRLMADAVKVNFEADEDERRRKDFEDKRKAHYNEFRVLKGIAKSPKNSNNRTDGH